MDNKVIAFDRKEPLFTGGDLVVLKSGGPVITVRHSSLGGITVDWFVAEENYSATFMEVQLLPAIVSNNSKKVKTPA